MVDPKKQARIDEVKSLIADFSKQHRGRMPSIIRYKETGPESWTEHFCLVKSDVTLVEKDSTTATAGEPLAAENRAQTESGEDPRESHRMRKRR
jgi:DNA-directed RNA polymerase alpha subunit